jgi:hypothetical protein
VGVVGWGGGGMYEFPSVGVVSGKIFIKVFRSPVVEVVAVLDVDGTESITSGVAESLAIDAVMLVRVVVFQLAVFGEMGASASVANVGYFFAIGSNVLGVYCVAFIAAAGFREEFAGDAAFAVFDCFRTGFFAFGGG